MAASSTFYLLRTLFNIGKKIVDILDDIWSAVRPYLPMGLVNMLAPFVMGGIGFITHLGEGIQAAQKAHRVYKNIKIGQRRTRLASTILMTLVSGIGMSLALSLGAAILGATVSATLVAVAPVVIPGLLTVIYSLALWRKSYVFTEAKKREAKCRAAYLAATNKYDYFNERVERLNKRYVKSRHYRLNAERKMAFNAIEVLGSSLVVLSTIFATAAIVGGTIASFGALPLTLAVAGVVVGVFCKALDFADKKYNFRISQALRSCFISQTEEEKKIGPPPKKQMRNSFLHKRLLKENQVEMGEIAAGIKGTSDNQEELQVNTPSKILTGSPKHLQSSMSFLKCPLPVLPTQRRDSASSPTHFKLLQVE